MTSVDRQQAFSGTKDAAPALRIDVAQLERYLATHINGFAGPLSVRQFKGGQSNPTYLLETPGRRYVLRRKPPGKLLPSAHAVDREYRVISALRTQSFPVSEPLVYCADESVAGTPFYVMGFVDGRVFWEPQMPGSNPTERAAVYDSMNETICAPACDLIPAKSASAISAKAKTMSADKSNAGRSNIGPPKREKIDAMERLIDWLPKHIPPNASVRLVHGDYRLDNMIVAAERAEIVAVLDWELSTLGDPLADFSYHLMAWHMPQSESAAGTASLVGHDLQALGYSLDERLCRYLCRAHWPRPTPGVAGLPRL